MRAGLTGRLRSRLDASSAAVRTALAVAGIVFVLLALVALQFATWYQDQMIAVMRSQVTGVLSPYSSGLAAVINQRVDLVESLAAFVHAQNEGEINAEQYATYAANLYNLVPDARHLTIAPDGIQRYVYPLDSTEVTPNHNLLLDSRPDEQVSIQEAIASGDVVISPPYALPAGGRGIVLRQAILEDDQFWGLVTLALDLDDLLAASGLADAPPSLRLVLLDGQGEVIYGNGDVRDFDPVIQPVALANLTWRLAAFPAGGWEANAAPSVALVRGVSLIVAGLIVLVLAMVLLRQTRLRSTVDQHASEVMRVNVLLRQEMERLQQVEAALQASEAHFRGAFTFASMGMALTDMDGSFIQVNDTLLGLLEYPSDELTGMKIWDIAHPSDREACHLMWQGVQEGARNRAQFELFCLTKTGNTLWAKIGLSLVRDEHDVPQYFIYQLDDRTQHKHMEEALWQQILRNELILQAASDGFCMINDQGVIQEVNPAFAAITGYRQEELLDRELRMLEAGDVPDRIDVYMAEALQHQSVRFETAWRRKDGQVARLAGSISLVEMDRTRFFFISVEDVTERRRSEQALRESQLMLQTLISNLPGMAYRCQNDRDWTMEFMSGACLDLTGYTPEELVGAEAIPYSSLIHPDDREAVWEAVQTAVERDQPYQMTFRLITRDGEIRWVWEQGREVLLPDGRRVLEGLLTDITPRIAVEEALRQSEERFRSLFEDVPISLWEEDFSAIKRYLGGLAAEGVADVPAYLRDHPEVLAHCAELIEVRDLNRAALDLYGWDDVPGLSEQIRTSLRDDINGSWQEELLAFLGGESEYQTESLIVSRTGEERDVIVRVSIPPGHTDTWDRVLVSMNDITQRKRAEAAERELRTLAEALRNSSAALVSTLDWDLIPQRILEYVGRVVPHDAANIMLISGDSAILTHLHGYKPEAVTQLNGMPSSLQTPNLWRMLTTGEPCLIRETRDDPYWQEWPQTVWVRSYVSTPLRAHGQVIGFLNLDSRTPNFFDEQDVDRLQVFADQAAIAVENAQLYDQIRRHAADMETRVAERTLELETERAQLQAILDSVGEGVVYTEDFVLHYANRRVTEMLGYSADELAGLVPGINDPDSRLVEGGITPGAAEVQRALMETRLWLGDLKMRRKDGSLMQASLIVTLVSPVETMPVRAVTLIRDVSQERALQDQKDRFIANASHELRTPLANMKMRLYLLRRQPERFAEHMEVLGIVTNRMERLVDDLLDKSRFERGVILLQRKPVDLRQLLLTVLEVQRPMAEAQDLSLRGNLPEDEVVAIVDGGRITQVVTNLVSNAISYTAGGGTITIDLERQGDQALIHVKDTGIGIPQAMQSQIFEPFFRVNEAVARGTGLGLTISREIVRMHRGDITVRSTDGEGSTFTVQLPLAPPGTGPLSDPHI